MPCCLIPCVRCSGFWTQWNKPWTWGAAGLKRNNPRTVFMVRKQSKPSHSTRSDTPVKWTDQCFLLCAEFDELSEDERKQSCNKRTSHKASSLKHLRTQRKSQTSSHFQNLLSSVKTATMIQPHSVTGLCGASYTHLAINPQLFAHFSAFTGQRRHIGASRTDGDVQSATPEGEQEISEADDQETFHRPGREGNRRKGTGVPKEAGQRSVKVWGKRHVRSEEDEATEGSHDIEKMIMGRKASKKHKSKWARRPPEGFCGTNWGNVPGSKRRQRAWKQLIWLCQALLFLLWSYAVNGVVSSCTDAFQCF